MDIAAFEGLLTPGGQALLGEVGAADVSESALLATASRLRARHSPELVGAALTQVRLRVRARAKFGAEADRMYFTPAGLEQATRASVARHRASRYAAHLGDDTNTVLDLGCGIGGDLVARGRAGCRGLGVDLDPLTAVVARANLAAFGLQDSASVRAGDAVAEDPRGHAAVFADPGRRTARGRVFDPEAYEPPLTTVLGLAGAAPAACVKVAPGIPHDAVPPGAEAEWISDGGNVKEAALWLGGLSGAGPDATLRRATVLRDGAEPATMVADARFETPPVSGWRRYLYEPDGAVVRAHLVGEVAATIEGALADPRIAYITSDSLGVTPFARAYEIHDVLPFSVKRLRAALRAYDAGTLTIKKRGFAADIERLRRDLRPAGSRECVVVLTRVGDAPVALICSGLRHHVTAEDTPP
ncbi:SAM-dependent methyltransferase [Actinomadura sp. DC4]|uniref:class I SAM-dependent methyltransferase n=1 Tax=Actinomadura sp. DC4 TaxID=3055069 RepID=UPI0025AEEA7E|nr:SAM-dependent methyltransferase [Actinomadura sp. DC4]MDN3357175.1 SAM-dependent methyltransferase [Actinomadura sp. DC4]